MPNLTERPAQSFEQQYKAPSGKVFVIHAAHYSPIILGANSIYLITGSVEEGIILETDDRIFGAFDTTINGTDFVHYPVPVRTKVLTIAARAATVFRGNLIVNFEFEPASNAELIWEFISRGKRP